MFGIGYFVYEYNARNDNVVVKTYSQLCSDHQLSVVEKGFYLVIRRGRKRLFLTVFDSFFSDRITAVFHRILNERKRSDTPFSGRPRQLLTVYDTTKNGRNPINTKW
jgi:hypothetical protein